MDKNFVLHFTLIVLQIKALRTPTKTVLDDAISCKVEDMYFREIVLAINSQGFNVLPIIDNRHGVK